MNPFLNLLDTADKTINVCIFLFPINYDSLPHLDVLINGNIIFSAEIDEQKTLKTSIQLLEPVHIEIISKNNNAAVIKSIKIDDFDIIPNYIHYSDYVGSDGTAFGPTEYLGVSGKWDLIIDKPFYNWKHDVTGMGWLLTP